MNDMILILNYSDEFAVEAAKRLRGERVFLKRLLGGQKSGPFRS